MRQRWRVRLTAVVDIAAGAIVVDGDDAAAAIAEALDELEVRLRDAGFDTTSAPLLSHATAEPVRWVGKPTGPLRSCRSCGALIGFARVDGRVVPVDPDGTAHGPSCRATAPLPGRPAGVL